jgi:hypothetical protein
MPSLLANALEYGATMNGMCLCGVSLHVILSNVNWRLDIDEIIQSTI